MKYEDVNLGDLVGLRFSNEFENIKLGLITALKKDYFIVKWIWYDKLFFLDNTHEEFKELNHRYLLTETSYYKDEFIGCLEILNSGNQNGLGKFR